MSGDEPKIFVDEDWKSQVQREREALARKQAEAAQAPPVEPAPDGELPEGEDTPFNMLVGTLATQAMFALGLIAPQGVREVRVDLEQAQISIVFLKVLQEKTQGNLSADEAANLNSAVQELEGALMARIDQIREQHMKQQGFDPTLHQPGP